jgi:hypothetical protein
MEHPKAVGDRSTLAILLALQERGYALYLPFGENTRTDVIADDGNRLLRLQCKTGRLRIGAVWFSVCSCYGHHRRPAQARRTYEGQIDAFAVYCADTGGVYLVPIGDVGTSSSATLRVSAPRNGQRRRIRFAADYEIGRVTTAGPPAPSGASGSSA